VIGSTVKLFNLAVLKAGKFTCKFILVPFIFGIQTTSFNNNLQLSVNIKHSKQLFLNRNRHFSAVTWTSLLASTHVNINKTNASGGLVMSNSQVFNFSAIKVGIILIF